MLNAWVSKGAEHKVWWPEFNMKKLHGENRGLTSPNCPQRSQKNVFGVYAFNCFMFKMKEMQVISYKYIEVVSVSPESSEYF